MMKPFALNAHNVYVAYNNNIILSNIQAEIPQGTMVAIIGPNGAGKTTFLKTVMGLLQPLAGVITCLGLPFMHYQHHLAYIPQRMSVDWDFPVHVIDVVLMGCYKRVGLICRPTQADRMQAFEVLEQVDMLTYANTPIAQLSGGQQQRVFLARALMQDVSLLFLDEPFIGIDIATEQKIIAILHALRNQGRTIFVVHHDLTSVREYFDWVLLLNTTTVAYGPVQTTFISEHISSTYSHKEIQHV